MADRKGPPRGSSEYYRSRAAALHSQAGAAARSGTAAGVKKSIALTRRADKLDVKASRSPKAAEMAGKRKGPAAPGGGKKGGAAGARGGGGGGGATG